MPPTAWPMMPSSGPAVACISWGTALPMPLTDFAATGSTSTFHTGRVSTTHSARLHAAVDVTPDGNSVAVSSQWSASWTASATRSWSRRLGDGSGC